MSDELETKREWRNRQPWPPRYIYEWIKGGGVNSDKLVTELRAWADAWDDVSTAPAASLGARPQEPGLSKEWLDELIRTKVDTRTTGASWGAQALAEAILESRRAPSGPLSDPEGVFEAMGMDEPKFPTTKKEGK